MNKRLTALLLVLCMILSIMPTVFAAGEQKFTDFPTGWSKEAMTAAVNNGLLVGVSDTEIKPQDNLTRAELAAIVVRAFGASTIADISAYKDVPPSEWYADYIAKAVKMEALNGRSATEMAPEANITREEVFVALARILVLESSDPSSLLKFKDAGSISAWAIPAMSALAAKGYINGDETGNVNPKAYITREEFAQFMHNMIKTYITKPGTYTDDDFAGITVIRTGDVTLKNVKNINDLVAGDGAGTGAIYLENVTIEGRLLTRGGHFTLKDTKVSENVVVKNVNNVVQFNNYRDEVVFLGINEITDAEFLEKSKPVSGGSSNNRPTVQTADYTVKHIREKLNPEDPDLIETETLNGEVGKNTSAVAKSYTGFTAGEVTQQVINENGSTVVEINYSRNTYTMTFALGNGQPDIVLNLKYEAPLSIGNPTWPGHVFAGWSPSLPTKVPAENKTYTAVWDAATANYTVKHIFEKLNDSDPDIIKIETKSGVVGAETAAEYLSDEVARELLGTLKYEGFEKGTITQVEIAESGTEVVINYTRKTYNVTFALGNGETDIVRPFKHGAMVVFTDTISKPGYTFNGWSPALGIINASDATYTAQWTANDNTGYAVEYYLEKLEGGYELDSTDDTQTGTTDTMTNVVAPAKEGFTAQTIEQKNINGDGSTVVKVYYTRNSYVITFVLGNGEADVVTTLKFGATLTAPTPTWYGHVFTGWTPSVPSTVPAENKTYTAVWDQRTARYTVKHVFEKLNESDPDIIKTEVKTGVVGAETAAEYLSDEAAQDFLGTVDYKGFKAPSSVTQVTIEESGTVVEIYYTRNEYKFVFVKGNGEANEEIMVKYQAPVNAPAPTWEGRTFNGWVPANAETPVLPEFAPVFPEGVTKFVYNATWTVKVTFFYYYTDSPSAIIDTKTIAYKGSVDAEYMDTLPEYSEDGYVKENQYAPTLYNGEKHKVYTDYLYKNDDGEWKNFDENVVVTKDTNVYCMFRKFGIYMSHPSLASFMVGATYAKDETRILDSVKDLLYSGKSQLSILTDLPEYQRVRDKLTNNLERTKVLNSDGEIKMIDVPVAVGSVISEEKMRGEVREYISTLINDPVKLDELFDMVDISDFIAQIDLEDVVDDSTILSFIQDDANEAKVIEFIRASLNEDEIRREVVSYLKEKLATPGDLRNYAIEEIRNKFNDETFRNSIIDNTEILNAILSNNAIKSRIVEIAIGDNFIKAALDDTTTKETLSDRLADYNEFVDVVIGHDQFSEYLIDEITLGGSLHATIQDLIDNNADFKADTIAAIKDNDEFMTLLRGDLRDDILDQMDSYATADEVWDYIFGMPGAKDFSSFVVFDLNAKLVEYAAAQGIDYDALSPERKQEIKEKMYANSSKKAEMWNQVIGQLETYKNDILDEFIANNGTVSNAELQEIIDNSLFEMVDDFVNDRITDDDVTDQIKVTLVEYVRDTLDVISTDPGSVNEEIKTAVESAKTGFVNSISTLDNDILLSIITEYRDADVANKNTLKSIIEEQYDIISQSIISHINEPEINTEVHNVLKNISASDAETILDMIISNDPSLDPDLKAKYDEIIDEMLSDYIDDSSNDTQVNEQIKAFINDEIDITFVSNYRRLFFSHFTDEEIASIVTEDMVKDYINNLEDKSAFVDTAYNSLSSNPVFNNVIISYANKQPIVINGENAWIVLAIAKAIKNYDYDQIIGLVNNPIVDKIIEYLGDDFLRGFFVEAQNDYYDGAIVYIDRIKDQKEAGVPTGEYEYTTSLTFTVNIIDDVLRPLYDKATTKAINVLDNRGINYHSNEYLEYLINQDYIYELIEETGLGEVNELTGYKIKNEKEYYDLIVKYVMLVDDAICWYGDNLTEEQIDAILEAVLTKIFSAHDKFNEILTTYKETGELPERVENLIDSVEQLNSLMTQYQPQLKSIVTKYLNSSFNQHFEPSDVLDKDKVQTGIDVILGTDDPTFTLDILYEVFYRYDDKMQAKLKQLVDSGKLERAINKFESTSFAELLRGRGGDRVTSIAEKIDEIKNSGKVTSAFDKMYDVFVLIAEHGIEPFRVEEDIETTVDAYEITYGGASFKVKRYVE